MATSSITKDFVIDENQVEIFVNAIEKAYEFREKEKLEQLNESFSVNYLCKSDALNFLKQRTERLKNGNR